MRLCLGVICLTFLTLAGCGKKDEVLYVEVPKNKNDQPSATAQKPKQKGMSPEEHARLLKEIEEEDRKYFEAQKALPKTPGPVKFKMTAAELAAADKADPKGYEAKYLGQRVELTGVVSNIRIQGGGKADILLDGARGLLAGQDHVTSWVVVQPRKADMDKFQNMQELAKGQTITVRGKVAIFGLDESEIVSVGPNPAMPVTVAELLAALDTDDGKAKYDGKAIIVRAKVREASWDKNGIVTFLIADPSSDKPTIEASNRPYSR